MAIPAINVLGNPNVTEGSFQIAIEDLRKSVIGSGKAYDSANTYSQYDTCVSGGIVYYSKINSNTGNTPSVGANWGLVSELIKLIASPTTNSLAKINADGTIGNSNIINDASGNVGINNNAPLQKLHVGGSIIAGDTAYSGANAFIGAILNNNNATPSLDIRRWQGEGTNHGVVKIAGNSFGEILFYRDVKSTNTEATTEVMKIDANGNLVLTSGTGALGYGTGSGGTVTQLTSKSTAVTLNKPTGTIIMNNSALAANDIVYFLLNNNLISINDNVKVSLTYNLGDTYIVTEQIVQSGVFIILRNTTSSSRSDAITLNFTVTKGANS